MSDTQPNQPEPNEPQRRRKKSGRAASSDHDGADREGTGEGAPLEVNPRRARVCCSRCGARFRLVLKEEAGWSKCPECRQRLRVPSISQARAARRDEAQAAGIDASGQADQENAATYRLFEAPPPARGHVQSFSFERRSLEEQPPPPPRWTFFSGVFELPWRSDVVVRWALLSLGLTAFALLTTICFRLFIAAGMFAVVAAGIFALPLIWVSIWTLSYAASLWLIVLQDTAGGNDRISRWPEPNWRDWAVDLTYIAFIGGVVLLVASVIANLIGGRISAVPSEWQSMGVVMFFLLPLAILSALESGSVFMPISLPVLRTLKELWWGWLVVYVIAAVLLLPWLALAYLVLAGRSYLGLLVVAPVCGASLLIHARVLGRLAWRAGQFTLDFNESRDQDAPEDNDADSQAARQAAAVEEEAGT